MVFPLSSILNTVKVSIINFFQSSTFNRLWFFIMVLVLGVCALLIWLMILMAIKSGASWKIKDWLKAKADPKKEKKKK